MLRIIPVFLLTFSLLSLQTISVSAQKEKPATKPDCRQTLYNWTQGNGKIVKDEHMIYNTNGLLIEHKQFICRSDNNCGYHIDTKEYDDAKNLIKSIVRDPKGTITAEYSCTFNADNQPVKRVNYINEINQWIEHSFYYNDKKQKIRFVELIGTSAKDARRTEEYLYEYHANGQVKKETILNTSKPEGPHQYKIYHENGLVESIDFNGVASRKYTYNANGQVVLEVYAKKLDGHTDEIRNEYNRKNLLVKTTYKTYGPLVNSESYFTYKYDKNNRRIKQVIRAKGNKKSTETVWVYNGESYRESKYDERNLLISFEECEIEDGLLRKKRFYGKTYLRSYIVYTYDAHKNIIKIDHFRPDGSLVSSEEWAYACD